MTYLERGETDDNSVSSFFDHIVRSFDRSLYSDIDLGLSSLDELETIDTETVSDIEAYLSTVRGYVFYPQIDSKQYSAVCGEIGGTQYRACVARLRVARAGHALEHAVILEAVNKNVDDTDQPLVVLLSDGTIVCQISQSEKKACTLFDPPFANIEQELFEQQPEETDQSIQKSLPYKEHVEDVFSLLRSAFNADSKSLASIYKASMACLLAMDAYRSHTRDFTTEKMHMLELPGTVYAHTYGQYDDLSTLSPLLRGVSVHSLLSDKVKQSYIPQEIDVFIVENYVQLLQLLHVGGYRLPRFRSDFMSGWYASFCADCEPMDVAQGVFDMFKSKGIRFSKGIVLPSSLVSQEHVDREQLMRSMQIHLLSAVYEQLLPADKQKLIDFGNNSIHDVRDLFAVTDISPSTVSLPTSGQSDEYAFGGYALEEKHWFLSSAMIGIAVGNKPNITSRHVWGDGTDVWHYLPKGMKKLISEVQWYTEDMPVGRFLSRKRTY